MKEHVRAANGPDIRIEKRRKYELKQQNKKQEKTNCNGEFRMEWIRKHSHMVDSISLNDVECVVRARSKHDNETAKTDKQQEGDEGSSISCGRVPMEEDKEEVKNRRDQHLMDWLRPYMDLKENVQPKVKNCDDKKDENQTLDNIDGIDNDRGRMFIAEGNETVRLLLRRYFQQENNVDHHHQHHQQRVQIISILVKPSIFFDEPVNLRKEIEDLFLSPSSKEPKQDQEQQETTNQTSLPFRILIGSSEQVLNKILQFRSTRGALACGLIHELHPTTDDLESSFLPKNVNNSKVRILAMDNISDTSNMGSIIRTSSALGIHLILLSNNSCDAWYRRSIRVSMGHVFRLPIVRVNDLVETLKRFSLDGAVTTYASVTQTGCNDDDDVTEKKVMTLESMTKGSVSKRWCLVVGNEGCGISKDVIKVCDERVCIEMMGDVDSFSVSVASGILLHGLKEREM